MRGKKIIDEYTHQEMSPQMRYYHRHKQKVFKRHLAYYHATKDKPIKKQKRTQYARKSKYGLTTQDYNKLLEHQKDCCAICRRHKSLFKKELYIDHDHTTGLVRGLLCCSCNTFLGAISDSTICLDIAKEYVSRSTHY